MGVTLNSDLVSSHSTKFSSAANHFFSGDRVVPDNRVTLIVCHGSKNPLVRSYLRLLQAAGQVKIRMISNEIYLFLIYANIFLPCRASAYFKIFRVWIPKEEKRKNNS